MKRKPIKSKNSFNLPTLELNVMENGKKICKHSAPRNSFIPVDSNFLAMDFKEIKDKNIVLVDKKTFDFLQNKK